MANPFFTVGHSTHPIEVFVAQLKDLAIEVVADVRAVPRSRKNPQFNRDVLSRTLSSFELDYTHVPELGGLRSHGPVPPSVNGFWQNQSFHNYADYAMSDEFQAGLRRLREIGHARQCAVMCAEAVWWRCHRRIIADYLIAAGETVIHILAKGRTEPAYLTKAAVRAPDGALAYPLATTIVGFHEDDEKHWVAELSCGHQQHVRHRPPLIERPWVETEAGRLAKIGHAVVCAECTRANKAK